MAQKTTYNTSAPVKPASPSKPAVNPIDKPQGQFVFDKSNYLILLVSIVIVVIGFILMSGTTDIYSDTKIVIAPLVVLAGFAVGFFAIFKKPATN